MFIIFNSVDRSSADVEKKVKKKRKPQEKWVILKIDKFKTTFEVIRRVEGEGNTRKKVWTCRLQRLELLLGWTRNY